MRSRYFLLLLSVFICFAVTVPSHSQDAKLVELRKDFARRYLQPNAHYALAKYYLDRGNNVQAFFITEYARRYRFEEKDFDETYVAFFGDPMPEPPDEAKDLFKTASELVTQQKYDEAETYFQKAYAKYDKSFFINVWIGRFYYKARSDNSKALPFYFKAYFLYPHAYETEYAEYRIRAIITADAEKSFKAYLASGKQLSELARDENPLIVGMAITEMAKNWKPEYLNAVLDAMSNDDSVVRWGAFVTLQKYAGTSLPQIVDGMFSDKDLRKRGLAAYAIAESAGQKKFQILEKMLSDDAELVRFDAVSALVKKGRPTATAILRKHARFEKQPRLKALIDATLNTTPRKAP